MRCSSSIEVYSRIPPFPGEADRVTFDNLAKAVEAFEATLVTPAPFDAFLNGDDAAMTSEQKQGLALFMEKGARPAMPVSTLAGRTFTNSALWKAQREVLPKKGKGRFAVTNTADDSYVFRAAPLRNVALTAPYFHSGKVWDLKQAVAIMGATRLGRRIEGRRSRPARCLPQLADRKGTGGGLAHLTRRNGDNASTCIADLKEMNSRSWLRKVAINNDCDHHWEEMIATSLRRQCLA